MRNVLVATTRTEVPDKQAHGIGRPLHLGVRPDTTRGIRQELAVGVGRIGIRDHHVGANLLAIGQFHTHGTATIQKNTTRLGLVTNDSALVFHQAGKGLHNGARATHG